jgi:hypothetical protein
MEIGKLDDGLLVLVTKKVENEIIDFEDQYLQIGLAPYLGEYGDFHTWIMVKSKKK